MSDVSPLTLHYLFTFLLDCATALINVESAYATLKRSVCSLELMVKKVKIDLTVAYYLTSLMSTNINNWFMLFQQYGEYKIFLKVCIRRRLINIV